MFITGHVAIIYNNGVAAATVGDTESGWELLENHLAEDIVTDSGGDAPVDGVQRGTRHELRGTYVDYDLIKQALYAANPRGALYDNVGKLLTSLAGRLIITPKAGTTAATEIGAGNSILVYKAIVLTDIATLLANKLRKGPITFRLYPDPTPITAGVITQGPVYAIVSTPAS